MENIKLAVAKHKSAIEKLERELRNSFMEDLKADLKVLKDKFPNLDTILVLGYTPEWNDGEECSHCSEVFIRNSDSSWNDIEDYLDQISGTDSTDYSEQFENVNKQLSEDEYNEIFSILRESKFEDALELVFKTDYNIIIDLNEITVTIKTYDCGY